MGDGSEHVLIAASYRWPAYAPAFATALERIGVKVNRFPFEEHLEGPASRLQVRLGVGPSIIALNLQLRSAVKHLRPTVCLIWTGLAVWPSTVRLLRRYSWVTSYTNDDPFGPRGRALFWRRFRSAIPCYDGHHVYRGVNVAEYRALGAARIGVLRAYYVPWLHYPEAEDNVSGNIPLIVFIGHGEPCRIKVLSALAEEGLPVEVYGPGETWRGLGGVEARIRFYPGTLAPPRYRQVISRAAICLGFLSRENRDDYTRRYFEIPACSGFLLAMRSEFARSLYVEGQEAEFFSTPEDAVRKCRVYLAKPRRRQEIAEAGRQRCVQSGYDVVSRARGWLREVVEFRE